MSNLCSATAAVTSEVELNRQFPNSVLPTTQQQRSEGNGRLTDVGLQAIYRKLVTEEKLVSNDRYKQILVSVASQKDKVEQKRILESVGEQEKRTMIAIQSEFCFYYVRYKYALDDLFETLSRTSAGSGLTAQQRSTIETKITNAKGLNVKLNDIIQFTNYLAKTRASEMRDQNKEVNLLNDNIRDIYGRLLDQNTVLQKEGSVSDLRRRMVEFTEEKNQSANSLLSLYGFLNLVALGLLFYVARS